MVLEHYVPWLSSTDPVQKKPVGYYKHISKLCPDLVRHSPESLCKTFCEKVLKSVREFSCLCCAVRVNVKHFALNFGWGETLLILRGL